MKEIIILAFLASQLSTSIPYLAHNFRPPGTVQIVDNFFIDQTEIRNADWKEYVNDLKESEGENSLKYLNALPDSKVWLKEGLDNEPFEQDYFSHPTYKDYPVVGVSYEQVVTYCQWRTAAVIKMLKKLGHKVPKNFSYRLPTKTEWELVANGGYDKKQRKLLDKKQKKDKKMARTCNMKFSNDSSRELTTQLCPMPIRTYLPNKYGVYNIYGNVAEMTAKKGIAMGGSFTHSYNEIAPTNKVINYEKPSEWLGFRCVCEFTAE